MRIVSHRQQFPPLYGEPARASRFNPPTFKDGPRPFRPDISKTIDWLGR